MKRRVVSAMLAAMMMFTVATPVLAADVVDGQENNTGGDIDVSATVEPPVYKISVPTSLDFYIDPFQQLAAGQITSDDFVIINKSNVALKVDATITVAGKDSTVTLKNAATDVTETSTDKLAYVEAEIPSVITETPAAGAAFVEDDFETAYGTMFKGTVGDTTKYYVATSSSAVADEAAANTEMVDTTNAAGTYTTSKKAAIDTTNGTTLTFALDKANYIDVYDTYDATAKSGVAFKDVAANGKGTAVFRFSGKVNTTAAWADGDITGNIAYTFTGLTPELYTANAAKVGADAHAYVVPAPTEAAPSIEELSYTMTEGQDVVITVNEGAGDLAADDITKITYTGTSGSAKELADTNYTYEDGTLTIKASFIDTLFAANISSRDYTIVFNDSAPTSVTITLTTESN